MLIRRNVERVDGQRKDGNPCGSATYLALMLPGDRLNFYDRGSRECILLHQILKSVLMRLEFIQIHCQTCSYIVYT